MHRTGNKNSGIDLTDEEIDELKAALFPGALRHPKTNRQKNTKDASNNNRH